MTDMDKKILDAFEIAAKTHDNIGKLIKSCKNLCKKSDSNYEHWKKKGDFLHWFESAEPRSWSTWLIMSFFKRKDNATKDSVYVMEINLYYPRITVSRFIYPYRVDYDEILNRSTGSSLALYDIYNWPVNNVDDKYFLEKINGFTKITMPNDSKYNKFGASHAWFAEFPLSEINAGNIQEKIFGTFDKLAALKS